MWADLEELEESESLKGIEDGRLSVVGGFVGFCFWCSLTVSWPPGYANGQKG